MSMAFIPSQAEAPGNMILLGEYAVLEGARAVLMTLKHRLRVRLAPADQLKIFSDRFGNYTGDGPKPQHVVLIENVLEKFFAAQALASRGFHVDIQSDIPPTYGFGSSAALVAAVVKVLCDGFQIKLDFKDMFTIGHGAILETFKRGSGADLAAALADMPFLVFDPMRKSVMPFDMPFGVQAIYTGYKTPTPVVLQQVREAVSPAEWIDVTEKMKDCVDRFIAAPSVDGVREYQSYMDSLGVTCAECRQAIDAFSACGIAAKISGSGRGDCIVGFSQTPVAVNVNAPLEFLAQQDLQT